MVDDVDRRKTGLILALILHLSRSPIEAAASSARSRRGMAIDGRSAPIRPGACRALDQPFRPSTLLLSRSVTLDLPVGQPTEDPFVNSEMMTRDALGWANAAMEANPVTWSPFRTHLSIAMLLQGGDAHRLSPFPWAIAAAMAGAAGHG